MNQPPSTIKTMELESCSPSTRPTTNDKKYKILEDSQMAGVGVGVTPRELSCTNDVYHSNHLGMTSWQVLVRTGGKNDPVVIETTLNDVVQKQVQKILHGLKEKQENLDLKERIRKMETEQEEVIPRNIRGLNSVKMDYIYYKNGLVKFIHETLATGNLANKYLLMMVERLVI
ncbi:unnamed protein product [Mytilus coruscus]|uniref:Uncharacterized protein n=1 Tax=Mytilus coruscus TaxID=42192 RepID=A0A6J8EF64_MYTCO|nr:unnamed protein product [Mytilus coruscus]